MSSMDLLHKRGLKICGLPETEKLIYVRCDPTTCKIINSSIVESILEIGELTSLPYMCGKSAYMCMPEGTKQDSLNLFAIVEALRILIPYHFMLGCNPIHAIKDGRLTPDSHSSITTGKVRICSTVDQHYKNSAIECTRNIKSGSGITLFSIDRSMFFEFMERRRMGIPIFPCSWEFYCIFVSLLCHPEHRQLVDSMGFRSAWIIDGNYESILERTSTYTNYPSLTQLGELLEGLWMRVDVLDVCFVR